MKKKKIYITVILLIVLIVLGLGTVALKWNKLLPYDLEGTYSAGNEPDDDNIYMVIKSDEFTIYKQNEILASGSIQEIELNNELEIYELFSEENTKIGKIEHEKNKIALIDFQSEVISLEKISRDALYLNVEPDFK